MAVTVSVLATAAGALALSAAVPDRRTRAASPVTSLRGSVGRLREALARRPQAPDLAAQIATAAESMRASTAAGASLMQAVARAGTEIAAPVGPALASASARVALGEDADESLDGVMREVGGSDVRLLIGALRMHRAVGGPLSPVLGGLAETLRERADIQRELVAVTAQARLSARVVMALPYGFLAFLVLTSGGAVLAELATPIGAACLGVGVGLQRVAAIWIRHITAPMTA